MEIALRDIFLKVIGSYSNNLQYNLECWNELKRMYTSKSRYYHNLEHLHTMITEFYELEVQINKPDALLFAIFYHDIVHNPCKFNNELKSALLFKKRLSLTHFSDIKEVMAQIVATKDHRRTNNFDTNVFLDLDLAILGAERMKYLEYCRKIRKEYKIFPRFVYRWARKRVVQQLLSFNSVYKTNYFFDKYEMRARANLKYSLLTFN